MTRGTGILALLVCLATGGVSAQAPDYRQMPFQIPAAAENLVVADLNGDGLQELLTVLDNAIRVYVQTASGFDFETGYTELTLSDSAVAWDLSDGYGPGTAIITLRGGRDMQAWQLDGNEFIPADIASGLPGFLGRGIQRVHFSRDINGDGLEDLVIPGAGVLHIYIRNSGNDFQAPLQVQSEVGTRTVLDINVLNRSAGQTVRIPALELRDVNGDDFQDLISRTEERLDVFLADGGGNRYFPAQPSYSLDIAEIEASLGEFDIDNVDFSNLTGVLALTHEEILDDVNNDGIDDLLLREGGKVSLFSGTRTGMNFEQPAQVLRSGGNVLSTFLYDENEDGLKDLWLWRVEPISVGDLFVWLALSGSIAIEAFIYPNDGERFARRPARRITIDLRFPSVLRLANAYESISSEAEGIRTEQIIPTSIASLGAPDTDNDLLVLSNNQVQVYLDAIAARSNDEEFLGSLGYNRRRDNYTINIREILEQVNVQSNPLLREVQDEQPAASFNLEIPVNRGDIVAVRLNNDAIDDAVVFTDFDASHIRGLLLLSN